MAATTTTTVVTEVTVSPPLALTGPMQQEKPGLLVSPFQELAKRTP